jgi:hypothetical protein
MQDRRDFHEVRPGTDDEEKALRGGHGAVRALAFAIGVSPFAGRRGAFAGWPSQKMTGSESAKVSIPDAG